MNATEIIAREFVDALNALRNPKTLAVYVFLTPEMIRIRIVIDDTEIWITRVRENLSSKRDVLDVAHAMIPIAINALTGDL